MTVSVFPQTLKVGRTNKLENITLRGFGGGWNAIETDLQMESTYLTKLRNFRRTAGGTQRIRFGSKFHSFWGGEVPEGDTILDMEYFSGHLIFVFTNGDIWAAAPFEDGSGLEKTVIWNQDIAAALPVGEGEPPATGWSSGLTTVDFVPYKNELIIHNGIDKPITISRELETTYLADLAATPLPSNINVPIGKYGCVVSNYHCVGGIAEQPTLIYISAVGTAGVFPGDPAPNDSITVDVGAFAPQGAVEIRGIAGFRANLLVFFQDQTVIIKLGTYNAAGVHEPFFPDTMPTFGLLGHRCIVPVENDLLFAGLGGVYSARRNLLSVSGTLETQTLSDRIEPEYRQTIGVLNDQQQLEQCWMVQDALSHDVLLFTPVGRVFVFSFNTKLRYSSWSEYSDMDYQCGCKTFLGRLFYALGVKAYQHGNPVFTDEQFYRDREGDFEQTWANGIFYGPGDLVLDDVTGESFTCILGHISAETGSFLEDRGNPPLRWELFEGIDISFELELPWLDSKDPMRVKFLRFVSLATKGDAKFMLKAWVDNLYKNVDGAVVFDPCLSMEFIGNEAVGFGYDADTYGGGRRSDDPRLWKFPVRFKKLKLAIAGTKAGFLEIVNMSFLFSRGKYKR